MDIKHCAHLLVHIVCRSFSSIKWPIGLCVAYIIAELDKLLSKAPGTGSDEFDCLNLKFGVEGRFRSAGLNFSPHL